MSKKNHMKDIMKYLGKFNRKFRDRQDVSDEVQTRMYFTKDDLQISIEKSDITELKQQKHIMVE